MIENFCNIINKLNKFLANMAAILIFIIVFNMIYEIVARYWFHSPTVWALELSTLLLGPYFMLSGPYLLHKKGHVNVDILMNKLSSSKKKYLNTFIYITIGGISLLIVKESYPIAIDSFQFKEVSFSSWNPYIWPIKAIIPISFFLLFLQSISELIQSWKDIEKIEEVG